MKKIFCSLALLSIFLALPVNAQTMPATNGLFIGGAINPDSNFLISGAYRKYISGNFYSLTFYDVSQVSFRPFNVNHAQYSGKQYLALYLAQPSNRLSLWLMGGGGVTGTSGISTSSTVGGGGCADFDFGRKIHGLFTLQGLKNTLTGTQFETRGYIGIEW